MLKHDERFKQGFISDSSIFAFSVFVDDKERGQSWCLLTPSVCDLQPIRRKFKKETEELQHTVSFQTVSGLNGQAVPKPSKT